MQRPSSLEKDLIWEKVVEKKMVDSLVDVLVKGAPLEDLKDKIRNVCHGEVLFMWLVRG